MKSPYLLVVGSINMDMRIEAPRLPSPGETLLGRGFAQEAGGKGANQAVAAARFGAKTRMLGFVGNDAAGSSLRTTLSRSGVDVSFVQVDAKKPTGVALITVGVAQKISGKKSAKTSGENTIVIDSGANASLTVAAVRAHADLIQGAGLVVLQHEIPRAAVRETLRLCQQAGVRCILNPAPALLLSAREITQASYITPNEHEFAVCFAAGHGAQGAASKQAALRAHSNKLIITEGRRGIVYHDGKHEVRIAAHAVKALDTTGAGDAFNGAFAASLFAGAELHEALRLANAAAAISVTRRGAQSSPSKKEALALLRRA